MNRSAVNHNAERSLAATRSAREAEVAAYVEQFRDEGPQRLSRAAGVTTAAGAVPGHGLSASTGGRLTTQWQDDARAFAARSPAEVDYVYLWVDGIHLKVRLEQDKVCLHEGHGTDD